MVMEIKVIVWSSLETDVPAFREVHEDDIKFIPYSVKSL